MMIVSHVIQPYYTKVLALQFHCPLSWKSNSRLKVANH